MFKNPLKYQQGGNVQNAMDSLVKYLVQNTGLDQNQITQRLQQILSDDTSKAKLADVLKRMQNNDTSAEQELLSMFTPQEPANRKLGGKINDFICKHAKGGKAGCGCKQEGGSLNREHDERLKPILPKTPGYGAEEEVTRTNVPDWEHPPYVTGVNAIVNGQHVWVPDWDYTDNRGGEYKMDHGYPVDDDNPSRTVNGRVMTPEEIAQARIAARIAEGEYPNVVEGPKGHILGKNPKYTGMELPAATVSAKRINSDRFGGRVEKHQQDKRGSGKISRLNSLNYVEREYDPEGNAIYTMAQTKETLPSVMRSDPFSDYSQNGGEYQGDNQIRIVDFGNGRTRIIGNPYGPMNEDVWHGSDSLNALQHLRQLASRANIQLGPAIRKQGGEIKKKRIH